jgi:hypothetical protein
MGVVRETTQAGAEDMIEHKEEITVVELVEIAHALDGSAARYSDWADDEEANGNSNSAATWRKYANRCRKLEELFQSADAVAIIVQKYEGQ